VRRPPVSLCLALVAGLAGDLRAQEPEDPVAFTVAGTVADADGGPAAGLLVQAWDALDAERYLGQAETGPKGRFLVPLRRSDIDRRDHPWGPVLLVARGQGLAQARVEVPAGARDAAIVVRPSVPVHGIVEDAEGHAVPAAVVRGGAGAEETTTGEDGTFVLTQFDDPDVPIEVFHDGVEARPAANALRPDKMGRRVFRLPATRPVRGRVVDAGTGKGVAGARLFVRGRHAGETGDDGRFAVAATAAAGGAFTADLEVRAPGYRLATAVVAEGDETAVSLTPAPPLRGTVEDAEGRPLEGCRVTLDPPGDGAWTDERGRFSFAVPPDGLARITAEREGFVAATVRLLAGRADEVGLRLRRGARVAGRVLRDGAAAAGARLEARGAHGVEAIAFSDGEGRFLFPGVPPEARDVVASLGGLRSEPVPLPAREEGEAVGPLTVVLQAHLRLFGTLRSDAGPPLAGAVASCEVGGEVRTVRADAAGRFDFGPVPVGEWEVVLQADRHAETRFTGWPGEPHAIVLASRFGERRVAVEVGAAGAPSAPPRIVLRRRDAPRVERTAQAASCIFEGLPPGTYDVEVTADGFLDAAAVVEVPEGGDPEPVRIALRRGGSVRLAGAPGVAVIVQSIQGRPPPVDVLKLGEGAQELRDFGPGTYRFISRAPGELIVVKEVELGPNTPPVELDLHGGKESTLLVRVKDPAGTPMDGAEIQLETEGGYVWPTHHSTDAEGRATVDRLIGGRVFVRATRGNRVGQAAVDVTPGAALEVDIVIR